MIRFLGLTFLAAALLSGCASTPDSQAGPNTPGWTGTMVIPGSTSTLAGNAQATYDQQKWQLAPRR